MPLRLSSACIIGISLCVVAHASAAAALQVQPSQWRNVAIKGGGFVSGLAFHPTVAGVLYARTDVGGAYRWQPDSRSWVPLNDSLGRDESQLTGVLSIGLDPHDADRVYLACGQYLPSWARNAAILRSNDRGATWSLSELPFKLGGNSDGRSTGERLQVDPNQGSILLLGTNQNGLWKSADHGETWSRLTGFSPLGVTWVVFDPRAGSAGAPTTTIYAGIDNMSGACVYRTTDAGVTWSAVPAQPTGLIPHHAKLNSAGDLFITYANALGPNGATTGAVWKLRTSDDRWTNLNVPTGQGGFAGVALDPVAPNTLVVTTLDRWFPNDEIYRSTDGGTTWKALSPLSVRDHASAPYAASSTPHWIGAIEIDPFDPARAFYITGYGIFGTENLTAADTNGQVVWHFRNDGLEETVPLGIVSPPAGAPLVSAIGDIDGFRHDDLTVSPARGRHTPRVGTNNSIDFAELAPDIMVRTHASGTQRGSRSNDGGATWNYFASAPGLATANNQGFIAISADASRIVWAPSRGALYFSNDHGGTWIQANGGPAASGANYQPVSDRVNPARFFVYDPNSGRFYASHDGGSSFTQTATGLPTGQEGLRATPGKEGHLWLPAGGSGLYRSIDGGVSWTKLASVQQAYRIGAGKAALGAAYPALYVWARIDGITGFFRSDDEGGVWTRINDDTHQFGWINALTGDPRVYGRLYLATGGRGIVYGDLADTAPRITATHDTLRVAPAGETVTLNAIVSAAPEPALQWRQNGRTIEGAVSATFTLADLQSSQAGLYSLAATNSVGTSLGTTTLVGVTTTEKVIGAGSEIGRNIEHPNRNIFDQVLLTGAAESITADPGQITRTSFVDLNHDIVQIEFSGPGTLTLVLADAAGPAEPQHYNQDVAYMRGHAGIVITGATEETNVSVFSVGRLTAFDPTGGFDFLKPISDTNNPANNGNPIFGGHAATAYDGMADIAFIAIASANGKFGGIRTANASYFATEGITGIFAPGVAFTGPLFIGDLAAADVATPALLLGSVSDARITGGSLKQLNGGPVQVSGITQLQFSSGIDSHGRPRPAKSNEAVLQQNGVDVTAIIVVSP